jgi:major membrane immunogen (membrane-anchored lipoprotein)
VVRGHTCRDKIRVFDGQSLLEDDMKKAAVISMVIFALMALVACSTPYRMMLKDNTVIEMADEPEFDMDTGFYEYETLDGKNVRVNKDQVVEIKEM